MLRGQPQCGAFSLWFGFPVSMIRRRLQGGSDRRKHRDRDKEDEEQFHPFLTEGGHVFLWVFLRLLSLHASGPVTAYGCGYL